jgi:hypothetical protein
MPPSSIEVAAADCKGLVVGLTGGTHPVAGAPLHSILRESNAPRPMWDEIQDMPGEIFDISDETRDEMAEAWDDDQALEEFSLECCFGPEE